MAHSLLSVVASLVALTSPNAAMIRLRLSPNVTSKPLTEDMLVRFPPEEQELLLRSTDERARGVTQELGDDLKSVRGITIKSNTQVRAFAEASVGFPRHVLAGSGNDVAMAGGWR
jgi:hypothetical protein